MKRFAAAWLFLLLFSSGAAATASPAGSFEILRDRLRMPDGVHLSVTYFVPISKKPGKRFPVLFEMHPYRKDDFFYLRDYSLYAYFARRGYVLAKVDVRGTGSSEGKVPNREYSKAELQDAEEVIRQLAAKPWSNGKIGMWGISWSGFNALQVAMRAPPALRAVLAADASDDLYKDDVHYIDGAFHVDEYALAIDHDLGLPRSPGYPLDRAYFKDRFERYPWILTYLKQQRDGPFWRRASLRWNYPAIQVPVYLIGGLLDGYRDSILRMLEKMKVPVKAVLGPWNHSWPDDGKPGPNFEWRREAVRWWDHWLKGENTGILAEPRFALFVRAGHAPDASLQLTPGHWRYEQWPISRAIHRSYYPASEHRLEVKRGEPEIARLKYLPSSGLEMGYWWGEPAGDMRGADQGSLVFDSPSLREKAEVIGFPKVRLKVSAPAKTVHWVARLEDVHPDGQVSLVTGAVLNGSQRRSRLRPEAWIPGRVEEIAFDLHFTTWTFQAGHRIRLALSNAAFPMIWPTPDTMTTEVHLGTDATRIELPIIPFESRPVPRFFPPEPREQRLDAVFKDDEAWPKQTRVIRNPEDTRVTVEAKGSTRLEIAGRRFMSTEKTAYWTRDRSPSDSGFSGSAEHGFQEGSRGFRLKTQVEIRSDHRFFHTSFLRELFSGGKLVKKRQWKEKIRRDHQ